VLAAFALGGAPTLPVLALVAVPVVVLVTEGFFKGGGAPLAPSVEARPRLRSAPRPA
jgi:hypothetical protein